MCGTQHIVTNPRGHVRSAPHETVLMSRPTPRAAANLWAESGQQTCGQQTWGPGTRSSLGSNSEVFRFPRVHSAWANLTHVIGNGDGKRASALLSYPSLPGLCERGSSLGGWPRDSLRGCFAGDGPACMVVVRVLGICKAKVNLRHLRKPHAGKPHLG